MKLIKSIIAILIFAQLSFGMSFTIHNYESFSMSYDDVIETASRYSIRSVAIKGNKYYIYYYRLYRDAIDYDQISSTQYLELRKYIIAQPGKYPKTNF